MKLLKPGDACPCCGRPIPEGLELQQMLLLSWVAEGMALGATIEAVEERQDEYSI